jgi:selenocysteine-specific elongation factor
LNALGAPDPAQALHALVAAPPHWVDAATFLRSHNVPAPLRAGLAAEADVAAVSSLLLSHKALADIRTAIVGALAAQHRSAPDLPGLQADRIRLTLAERPPVDGFRDILMAMVREGAVAQDGPWLRLPGHRISLSPQGKKLWLAVEPLIAADRFRPPRTRDLAQTLKVQETALRTLLKQMQRMGRTVEIAPDHFFLREVVAEMAGIAVASVDDGGELTAAAFRDRLDNGRKVAIQILEYFDRAGLTVRTGDARRVRPDRIDMFGSPERFGSTIRR